MTRRTRSATHSRVPLVVLLVAIGVVAVGTVLMFWGGQQVGATWDERIHALMTQTFFETGWYVSPDWLVNGQLDAFTGKWPYFVYAPVASLIAHAAAVLTGNEGWTGFSDAAAAHAARHLGTAFIAFLGIVGAGLVTWLVTRSWRWGVVGAAMLASVPMWVGHGMFNVKDLPVGTGYTLATLGFVAICRRDYGERRRLRVVAWAGIVVGLILAVGTRPASGLPIALTGIGIGAGCIGLLLARRRLLAGRGWSLSASALRARAVDAIGAMLVAYVLLVVIYPNGFLNPFRLVKETLLISGRFPVNDPELTAGVWLPQPPPWTYLPTWFGAQLTLLVLAGSLVLAVCWVVQAVRVVRSRPARTGSALERLLLPVPVFAQALLLPLLAIAAHSTMYNAVRQFIFVVPAAAVLATLGVKAVVDRVSGRKVGFVVTWVVVVAGLVVPVVDQVRLFPYTYVYFNEIASTQPIDGNWATDYWRASGRELVRIIPEGRTSCIFVDDEHDFRPCDADATLKPFWAERGLDAIPADLGPDEYWLVRENHGDLAAPPGCTLHDQLTRPLRGQDVTIAQVFRCTAPATAGL